MSDNYNGDDFLSGIDWLHPTAEDLQRAEEADALHEIWLREKRLGMDKEKDSPKPKTAARPTQPKPEPVPERTSADIKFDLERKGIALGEIASKLGPTSEHYKRAQAEHQALQVELAERQTTEFYGLQKEAAALDLRRRAKADAEAQVAAEKEQAEKIARSIAELEGVGAAKEYLRRKESSWSEEGIAAKANEAFDLRWRVLSTQADAATATQSLPPSEQEMARKQARDQVLHGSDAYIPKPNEAQAKAIAQALSGEPHAEYVSGVLDRELPGWRKTDVYRRLRARNLGER